MPGLNMGYGRINADYFNLIKISSTDMLLIQANGDSGLGDLLFEIYINDHDQSDSTFHRIFMDVSQTWCPTWL